MLIGLKPISSKISKHSKEYYQENYSGFPETELGCTRNMLIDEDIELENVLERLDKGKGRRLRHLDGLLAGTNKWWCIYLVRRVRRVRGSSSTTLLLCCEITRGLKDGVECTMPPLKIGAVNNMSLLLCRLTFNDLQIYRVTACVEWLLLGYEVQTAVAEAKAQFDWDNWLIETEYEEFAAWIWPSMISDS